jgi:hypothetical protein
LFSSSSLSAQNVRRLFPFLAEKILLTLRTLSFRFVSLSPSPPLSSPLLSSFDDVNELYSNVDELEVELRECFSILSQMIVETFPFELV